MPTITATHCLECNAPLTAVEAQGLCARCLLKMSLASQLGETSVADAATRRLVPPPLFPFDFGEYRVTRLLGRGGMGAVYEAEQRESGRRVALKVLGHTIDSPDMRKRFLREGRLAAAVNHPNSVYIFGTEEIDATPVIAMELVAGGTLKDELKKRGPLPVREAVDAILHVIAGLEAAQAGGILHRDVKPANCFVAPDGTVKVGDFGLSVSTLATHDSELTASGMMLGTPSFAPPEQLRGDELDVRADIYSVGATLYALLTGRPPFDGGNAVQVVAAVLDKTPKPITDFRQDVPPALAQIVGKCLAKKRDERFAGYVALRDALTPFSSQATEPAPLGLRTVAGMIDLTVATLFGSLAGVALTGGKYGLRDVDADFLATRTWTAVITYAGTVLFAAAYFALPEGRWGASLGKFLCGLRVVGPGRSGLGMPRAVARALIVMFAVYFAGFLELFLQNFVQIRATMAHTQWSFSGTVGPGCILLIFVTMRRRNGFAAVQDLITGTRVISHPKASGRPRLDSASVPAPEPAANAEHIGPFRVIAPLGGAWVAAFDDVLRRQIWIRRCAADAPALAVARRDLGRATRLRWIAGARSASGWDAFDPPTGKPLLELARQPWAAVRCWLLDLTEEIAAATNDGTLPAQIGLDRVFITADGHAVLLDEPWPGAAPTEAMPCANIADTQRFLAAVATTALDYPRLPLHARDFLEKLRRGAFDRASFIAGNLRSLLSKPAEFTRLRRFASLALLPGLSAVFVIPMTIFIILAERYQNASWAAHPEMRKLELAMAQYQFTQMDVVAPLLHLKKSDMQERGVQLAEYISGHWGSFITSPQFDADPVFGQWPLQRRDAARWIVQQQPAPSAGELARVDKIIDPLIEAQIPAMKEMPASMPVSLVLLVPVVLCASQFVSILLFGATLGQRLFGFAVVNARGEPAARARMLWRWCIAWVPAMLISWLLLRVVGRAMHQDLSIFGAADLLLWLVCLAAAIGPAERGLHDKLAGTRIVPR